MTIYSLDVLLSLFGTSLLFHVQFKLLLPDLHIGFSRGRSGGLVFPSLSEFYGLMAFNCIRVPHLWVFPGGTNGKESTCQCKRHRDIGSIPGSEWSLGGRHSNPLQYSCLENPMDRGAWQTTVHRIANTCTQLKWLSPHARTPYLYPLICWWTFRLLPFLGYGKQCCNKHWGQYVFLSYGYMWYSHFRRQPGVSDGK